MKKAERRTLRPKRSVFRQLGRETILPAGLSFRNDTGLSCFKPTEVISIALLSSAEEREERYPDDSFILTPATFPTVGAGEDAGFCTDVALPWHGPDDSRYPPLCPPPPGLFPFFSTAVLKMRH